MCERRNRIERLATTSCRSFGRSQPALTAGFHHRAAGGERHQRRQSRGKMQTRRARSIRERRSCPAPPVMPHATVQVSVRLRSTVEAGWLDAPGYESFRFQMAGVETAAARTVRESHWHVPSKGVHGDNARTTAVDAPKDGSRRGDVTLTGPAPFPLYFDFRKCRRPWFCWSLTTATSNDRYVSADSRTHHNCCGSPETISVSRLRPSIRFPKPELFIFNTEAPRPLEEEKKEAYAGSAYSILHQQDAAQQNNARRQREDC